MAQDIQFFTATITAGATKTAPSIVNIGFQERVVRKIDIQIPPGPRGTMGFVLGSGGTRMLPSNANSWIIGDDRILTLELDDQITSGAWQVIGYNGGSNDHTIYLTFFLDLVPGATPNTNPMPPSVVGASVAS